ncbi:Hypothetical predicted protein [Podarcis lilfordi]|uniref:Uncharacterized protein n=1 Tax=Podarcis lilfordi TaxID=74358 RepID=A0AA35JQK3_9SAUR|nr:Hypothetical predicted protein [Podarcis lilfordi]
MDQSYMQTIQDGTEEVRRGKALHHPSATTERTFLCYHHLTSDDGGNPAMGPLRNTFINWQPKLVKDAKIHRRCLSSHQWHCYLCLSLSGSFPQRTDFTAVVMMADPGVWNGV